MKAHSVILFTFFVLIAEISLSQQTWPPTGAVWHYETHSFGPPPFITSFMTITVTGDTTINGQQCKQLIKNPDPIANCTDYETYSYLYTDSNVVYWYNTELDTFTILYDFNAEQSDSWDILVHDCSITVTVDSTSTITINQDTLKEMFVSTSTPFFWEGTIIERIGHSAYLLPSLYYWYCTGGACDMDWWDGLRCYEDQTLGLYETGLNPCDTIVWTRVQDRSINETIKVYPTTDYLVVTNMIDKSKFQLYDLAGNEILEAELLTGLNKVKIKNLASGIYIYRIEDLTGKVFIKQ